MDVIDNRDDDDYIISIEMYLTGDLKILFMMMGRSGYSAHYCLFYRLKQSEWEKLHSDRESIHCGSENWTTQSLAKKSYHKNKMQIIHN